MVGSTSLAMQFVLRHENNDQQPFTINRGMASSPVAASYKPDYMLDVLFKNFFIDVSTTCALLFGALSVALENVSGMNP